MARLPVDAHASTLNPSSTARVAATDTFVAYQPRVEDFILPQAGHVAKALAKVTRF